MDASSNVNRTDERFVKLSVDLMCAYVNDQSIYMYEVYHISRVRYPLIRQHACCTGHSCLADCTFVYKLK